ncbi:MAG: phosphoglucosamine mutase [Planctomycetota bacterium]
MGRRSSPREFLPRRENERMRRLMIGVSGVRGVVGETFTPELLTRLGEAFGTYTHGGKIVVGRDTRTSGEMVKHAVLSGLLSAGCEIVDLGISATPSAAMMIPLLRARGGVVISASHNAVEWNALKFFRADGVYLNDPQGRELLDIYYGGDFRQVNWDGVRTVAENADAVEHHVERILKLVDARALRRRKFTVALDCCNGAGVEVATQFLSRVGCRILPLFCKPDGLFPRTPEPTREHVTALTRLVRRRGADVGFALDPDADRVACVSEAGRYVGEEYTLALSVRYVLGHKRGAVVTNVSTSRMIDDVAAEFGCAVVRVPVGEVNVADRMLETKAVIGGEGNGGVIYPPVHYSRDSIAGMALILQYLLESGRTLSALVREIPAYTMVKTKVECDRASARSILPALEERVRCDAVDRQDGVKFLWKDAWVHLRGSNTEPVLRIISEARSPRRARALAREYSALAAQGMKRWNRKNS